jgi:type IV pilus assembly protein PilB
MTHPFQRRPLPEILIERRFASADQLQRVRDTDAAGLPARLLSEGVVTAEQLAQALADQFDIPYADLAGFVVPSALFEVFPATRAYQLGAVPYRLDDDALEVVIADPFDLALPDRLEAAAGRPVRLRLGTREAIDKCLRQSQSTGEVLKNLSEDFRLALVKDAGEGRDETITLDKFGAGAAPVVQLVNSLVLDALARRASDIHIEAYEHGVVVKYRVDGVLYPATGVLDRRHHASLVSRLKIMAELDIAEKRVPQDGRFRLRVNEREIDFRISVLPSVFGEDVVIRILDKQSITEGLKSLRLEALGMAEDVLRKFRRAIHEPYGMVLMTGPTGSGKTTTLYAALSELNAGEDKIITIEDPVEYQLDGVVQIPVNEKKGLTFARGLRSILRHDPDKIMVGEIRDTETAQIAVQSALTGHLVFTTVHANNAFDVIGRFAHMGVDVHNFVSALNCVMAQRLVRLVCPHCKQLALADPGLLEASGLEPRQYAKQKWAEGKGCEHCHQTGYHGRAAITEFLDLSPRIRQMIVERAPAAALQAAAVEEGMVTLRQSAVAKALAGETTLREINRVTFVD